MMNEKEKQNWLGMKYPCTVIRDRYCGTYSGAEFLAFPLGFYEVPMEVDGSDTECAYFWKNYEEPVGKGASAQEAIDNLVAHMGSEDEKVRKFLLGLCEACPENSTDFCGEIKKADVLAWLEKQKEQKPVQNPKKGCPTYPLSVVGDLLAKTQQEPIRFEQKQKPAEWSEEDERMWEGTLNSLKKYQLMIPNFQVELQMKWLKKMKEK